VCRPAWCEPLTRQADANRYLTYGVLYGARWLNVEQYSKFKVSTSTDNAWFPGLECTKMGLKERACTNLLWYETESIQFGAYSYLFWCSTEDAPLGFANLGLAKKSNKVNLPTVRFYYIKYSMSYMMNMFTFWKVCFRQSFSTNGRCINSRTGILNCPL
jgi:hypothetical protein